MIYFVGAGSGAPGGITTAQLLIPAWATMWLRWIMPGRQPPWSRITVITAVWYSSLKAAETGMSSVRLPMGIPLSAAGISA